MKNISVILFFILIICSCSRNQVEKPDGIPDGGVQAFDSSFNELLHKNPMQAKQLTDSLLQTTTDSVEYYSTLSYKALAYLMLADDDSMLNTIERIDVFSKSGNADTTSAQWRKMMFNFYDAKGIYLSFKKEPAATYFMQKAIEYSDRIYLPQAYMNLAECNVRQGSYVDAAENYRKALAINDSIGKVIRPDYIFNGLAMSYMQISDYDEAERYLQQSALLIDKMDDNDRYVLMNNFGNLYYYMEEYEKALPYFQKAVVYTKEAGNSGINAYVPVFNEAEIYILLHKPILAKECIDTLEERLRREDAPMFEAHLRTLKLALYVETKELRLAAKVVVAMAGDELPFELQRIRNRYMQKYYEATADYKKAYELQLRNNSLSDSLKSIQIATRVADIYMRYQQDTTLIAKQNHIHLQEDEIKRTRELSLLWTSIALMLGCAALSTYLIMRRKRDKMEARHIEKIGKLRMENIRNCLSPHFTFNVLNHEISQYDDNSPQRNQLIALTKILRRSVEVSSQMTVTLQEELDFVNNYINLECGIWQNDFDYTLDIGDGIDASSFIIPSMFIQIPVENAIKHGLRGIKGKKELRIAISKHTPGIKIIIENNGTGYKPQLITSGTGKGMQVIYQTILLLNRKNTDKIEFHIGQCNPAETGKEGTKVEILIPSKFDYSAFK